MTDLDPIFVNIPVPTREEGKQLCHQLLEKDLCGTAKLHDNVHLMWKEENKVQGDDINLMTLKTTRGKLADIHEFILKNHSWGTPCIEVVPILADLC